MNHQPLFANPHDEERLCQVLRAYVEEFEPEYVTVVVPEKWKTYRHEGALGRVKLEFTGKSAVTIKVNWQDVELCYSVQLQAV